MVKKTSWLDNIEFRGIIFKSFKWVVLFEFTSILGSYYVWNRLNRDQDFRLAVYKNQNWNWILEGYYQTGEILDGDTSMRDWDQRTWKKQGSI